MQTPKIGPSQKIMKMWSTQAKYLDSKNQEVEDLEETEMKWST